MENYENELINELRSVNLILREIWTEIGFDQETCVQRQTRIIELVKELLSNVLNGETLLKTKLATSIEENGKEFYHLNKELGTAIPDPDDSLTLLEVERYLRHNVEELLKEVNVRRNKLKELRDIEQELCERLVEEPSNVPKKPIPSKEDLEDLERRIRTLEQEKVNREKTFRHLKSNLSRLLDELELKANSSLELNVLSDVEDLFTLSRSNLHQMKQLNERYEQMVKENERESLHLHNHIRLLYDRLEVDPSERDIFLDTIHGHTPSVLKKLQQEMHRLEELKHQNMARFINKLRRELEVLWDKCYISENERNAFTPYFAGYTDEVLKAHDNEVQKLQTYYSDNKLIFMKIKQRHEIWNKLVELEEKANDPNRLFGNRGCSLLQEEKERKRVKNELPRVEKELEDLVLAREKKDGQQFLVEGKTISDYIMDQWHQYHEQKEQEKRERQNARSKLLNSESRLGSKPPSVKRRIARNDTLRTSKLRRIGEEQSLGRSTPVTPSRGTRSVLREHDQNTLKNVSTNLFPKKDGTNLSSGEVSSYSHFSDGIQRRSERENMRSSAVHGTKKTPLIHHPSPRHPPPGLPKTPKTLPRIAIRRSPRHSGNRSVRRSPKSATVSRLATPSSSSAFRSPHIGGSRRGTPNRWSKLSFLI
ncbi:protein regulator of cytokinesis 1 isoform X2 [Cherax quadricarinatus]|uniref:protein regulator of cytokinesis 1 isoform X2 n=1 Tax=Cherax quadricarinatus TaxID=27406 RepID=UPI00387EE4CB